MKKVITVVLCAAIATSAARAFETPTMGWSSWNTYRVNISDSLICRQADALVKTGLSEVGYRYVNIDDGFFGGRDGAGRIKAHAGRFPNGLKPVVDHVHSLGLKAGIYSDAGRNTCGNFWDNDSTGVGVGFYGHDADDAAFYFDESGFDFIKIDFCGGDGTQNSEHLDLDEHERYRAIRMAIDSVGRDDVRVNVCRWSFPGTWVREVGSSWRIAADITPDWQSVKRIIAANKYLSAYAGEGHYNDMDMLEIGRGLSDAEERTHFGMWCMMSSPLLIGCDLTAIPDKSLELIKNPELIGVNQDSLGLQARLAKVCDNGVEVYVKDVATLHGLRRAVALCNPTDSVCRVTLSGSDVDLTGNVSVRNLFARRDEGRISEGGSRSVSVDAHDTVIYLLEGEGRDEQCVYEAEAAWLERFQQLGYNPQAGYAEYVEDAACSGGAKVSWLGNHADNWLEWRDVWSRDGGDYEMTVHCPATADGGMTVAVNGGEAVTLELDNDGEGERCARVDVKLSAGENRVRISGESGWVPDIDFMSIRKK